MTQSDPFGFAVVLAVMTIVVYLSRTSGFWLIGRITIGPRLQKILEALPGAVIVSTVAPILITGGIAAWFAVVAAAVTMIALRNDFAAVFAGIAVAALVRAAGI
ncbi:MAG: AzlD domain-containing protein [Pseudolabrys sp.]